MPRDSPGVPSGSPGWRLVAVGGNLRSRPGSRFSLEGPGLLLLLKSSHIHRQSHPGEPSLARVVLVTHPAEGAQEFARAIVGARLAACVNLIPTTSVYRWEGEVEAAEEVLLVIKTSAVRMDELRAHVLSAHPYDCPEFLGLVPGEVEARYLTWLLAASSEEEE